MHNDRAWAALGRACRRQGRSRRREAAGTPAVKAILLAAAVGVVVSGCGAENTSPWGSGEESSLEGGTWVLTEGTVDARSVTVPAGRRISLTVDGDRAGGTAACNDYGAMVDLDGQHVTVTVTNVTDMGCGPAAMEAQDQFLRALPQVTTAVREGDQFQLTGPEVALSFTRNPPVPAGELIGTTWRLDTLIRGDTVTTSEGKATLVLRDDNTIAGSTGCRQISGQYQLSGDQVRFTSWGLDGDCSPELEGQDEHVRTVLEGGFRVEVEGSRLTLISQDDQGLGYTAERRPSAQGRKSTTWLLDD